MNSYWRIKKMSKKTKAKLKVKTKIMRSQKSQDLIPLQASKKKI